MSSRNNDQPNILFVLTDDQGPWAMNCAGCTDLETPNLDKLASRGMRFDHFFCTSPVCSPARASILTGRIPSQHGVHDWISSGNSTIEKAGNGKLIEYLQDQTGYTDILAANGYNCGISGKWHLGDAHHSQKGFSFWEVHAMGGGAYYNAPVIKNGEIAYEENKYITDVITDNALKFLTDQENSDAPFYLSVHYTAPHTPWGRDQHPKETFDRYFNECEFTSVPNEPIHPWEINSYMAPKNEEQRRLNLSGYFTAITEMDRNLGRLITYLEEKNLTENTLVVFMSDNGMNMGHNGVWGKGNGTFPLNMYENSVKIPCIMSRPGSIPEGVVCSEMLSQYDFMPTLLDYTGFDNPEADKLPGKSFAPLLKGDKIEGRENVVVFDEYGPVRMIRNRECKYIHRYPYGPHEFYDLIKDPNEHQNLFSNPAHQDKIAEMKNQLDKWFLQYVNPDLDGTHHAVNGHGQLNLAGIRSDGKKNFNTSWENLPEKNHISFKV